MRKNAYSEMFAVEDKHWWYVTLHDLVTVLCDARFPRQPIKILDAGCGTGGLLSIFSQAGHDAEGLDCSKEALDFCRNRGLEKVIEADINDFVPNPNSYDIITSMDVLYHEWVHDQVKVLRTLSGGLKQNGLMLLNYPAFPILSRYHDKVVMVRERYTKKSVRIYLAEAGLIPVIISYRLPHAFLYLLLLRVYETIKHNQAAKSDVADIPSGFINRFLIQLGRLENRLIAKGVSIPFGSSLFVMAKKASGTR